jgi:hypothetical protein
MSCSRQSATKYLIDKNLVKPNMELYSPIPSRRLSDTIERLTRLAKSTYGVDMGDLFKVKFRDVEVGSYILLGPASTVTKARLEANVAAFEAIDRSKAQETFRQDREVEEMRTQQQKQVEAEYEAIQNEGNFIVSDEGEIQVPSSLPQINVRC